MVVTLSVISHEPFWSVTLKPASSNLVIEVRFTSLSRTTSHHGRSSQKKEVDLTRSHMSVTLLMVANTYGNTKDQSRYPMLMDKGGGSV